MADPSQVTGHSGDLDPLTTSDPVAAILAEHARPPGERRTLALRTSGTSTGQPRVVRRSTASWVDSFPAFSTLTGTGPDARVWVPGPPSATMNLFAGTHATWAGARLVEDLDRATHAHLTPARAARLLAQEPAHLAGRTLVLAGDTLPLQQGAALRAAGARVHHYYGAAELSFVAWGPDATDLRAFPGVEVRSHHGALQARSPYVAATATPDAEGWCSVGDLGTVGTEGRITVTGRPDTVTTAGATVTLSQVEAALAPAAPLGVRVVGVPHPDLGAVLVGVVTDATAVPALTALAREVLTPAARPRRWQVLAAWPLTPQGKIDRTRLDGSP